MTHKAQYGVGVHLTDVPMYMKYSSDFRCDTVCVGFLMAALNNLEV